MESQYDCTKCYRAIPAGEDVEVGELVYHRECSPPRRRTYSVRTCVVSLVEASSAHEAVEALRKAVMEDSYGRKRERRWFVDDSPPHGREGECVERAIVSDDQEVEPDLVAT